MPSHVSQQTASKSPKRNHGDPETREGAIDYASDLQGGLNCLRVTDQLA
jgi:hypothetical protein